MYHVLVPDNVDQQAIDHLKKADNITVNAPGKLNRADLLAAVPSAHALIIRSGVTIDEEVFAAAPELKAIARAGVGVDNIDLEAATRHGVVVMNTPFGNTISTAEYTIGMMLSLARHIPPGYQSLKEGRWDRKAYVGMELRGKTLGLIGFGRIGQAVASRTLPFQMNVITYDPIVPAAVATEMGVEMVDMDTLLSRSDFISLHTALTDATRGMIGADVIARMKPGVRIINAARGALIDDAALADAIQSGHVAAAALDVYEPEPPADDNPLIGLDNVLHTPHLAASTSDAQVQVGLDAVDQIVAGLTHGHFENVVNPDVLK